MIWFLLSGDRARRSPRKLPTAMKEEKKKWVMPKFLPHKYDVKLINEDKVCQKYLEDSFISSFLQVISQVKYLCVLPTHTLITSLSTYSFFMTPHR